MNKQRYEREIEEILRKYDEEKGQTDRPVRQRERERETRPPIDFRRSTPTRVPRQTGFTMPDWKRLSSGQYMLLAFGAAILAVVVNSFVPFLSTVLVILAIILFLLPIFLYRNTGTTSGGYSPTEQKRWRGQVIDFNTRREVSNDPLAGIKRWLRRR
jgi:Flp pilus assembly protein TadB